MTEIAATGLVDSDDRRDEPLPAEPVRPADRAPDEDAEFAEPSPKRQVPALTKLLVGGILVAMSFAGGAFVQKQHDASQTSAVPGGAGGAEGFPAFLTGVGATGAGSATGRGPSTAASGPVLVGTIESVSGGDITVKDLGGKTHAVHTGATTGFAVTGAEWSTSLPPGTTVSIEGTKADDGTVTATTITRR